MPDLPVPLSGRTERDQARIAIATVATTSYLHWATALAGSAAAACPDAERALLWVDAPATVALEDTATRLGFNRLIVAEELAAAEALASMRARYSARELC